MRGLVWNLAGQYEWVGGYFTRLYPAYIPPISRLKPLRHTKKLISQHCGGLLSSYFAGFMSLYRQTNMQSLESELLMVPGILPPSSQFGYSLRQALPLESGQ